MLYRGKFQRHSYTYTQTQQINPSITIHNDCEIGHQKSWIQTDVEKNSDFGRRPALNKELKSWVDFHPGGLQRKSCCLLHQPVKARTARVCFHGAQVKGDEVFEVWEICRWCNITFSKAEFCKDELVFPNNYRYLKYVFVLPLIKYTGDVWVSHFTLEMTTHRAVRSRVIILISLFIKNHNNLNVYLLHSNRWVQQSIVNTQRHTIVALCR